MAGQSVIISVLAQTQQFSKGMKSASDTANSTFKKVAGLIAGAFSIAVVTAWAKDVADQFMQLEDDLGNIGVQMGSKTAQHFNDSFAGKLAGIGLSKVEATSLGSMLSTTFEKAGLSGKQLESTIVRVRDISGATGQDNTTIARAWEAAERGKYAAMEKTLGLSKGTMKTLVEEKMKRDHLSEAEARHAVLMQQTHKMQGEAKKDADTLGGQLEIAKAMWSNMGQAIAEKVMPYVIQFGKWITGTAVPKLQEFGTYIQNILGPALEGLGKWIQDNTTWLAPLGVAIGVIVAAFVAWQSALAIWSAITTAATAIQGAFNAILLMNPIMLVVVAIAALVAGLVYFFTQTETGRKIWQSFTKGLTDLWSKFSTWIGNMWKTVVKMFEGAAKGATDIWTAVTKWFSELPAKIADFFTKAVNFIINIFLDYHPLGIIIKNWNPLMAWFASVPGKIKDFFSSAVSWLVSAGSKVLSGLLTGVTTGYTTVATWFREMDNKIKGFFDGATSWLKSAGGNIVEGLWKGISNGYGWIKGKIESWVGNVLDFIKHLFGIKSPSTVMAGYGDYLVRGLSKGITSNLGTVQSAMAKLSDTVSENFDANLALDTVRAGGTVNQYFIDGVNIDLTPEEETDFLKWADSIKRKSKVGI